MKRLGFDGCDSESIKVILPEDSGTFQAASFQQIVLFGSLNDVYCIPNLTLTTRNVILPYQITSDAADPETA